MADKFELKALITAVDKLSPTLKAQLKTLNIWKRQFESAGKGGFAMGAGLAAGMAVQVKAFADVESSQIGLMNTLMNKNGVAAGFEQISKIATELGNQLPGTTADFNNMAAQLRGLGVDANTIAGGALKATAYLAVVGQRFGVTYEGAAEAVGKVGNAFGIAAADLVPFADILQRTQHLGVNLSEMQFAMAKLSPRLKSMGQQGLGVAKEWAPLAAMLIRMGMSGETVGTGLEKLLSGFNAAGKFHGVEAMVKELGRLQKTMGAAAFSKWAKKQFGDEGERLAAAIDAGGYQKILAEMKEQASLQQRVNNSLGTLTNLWESATGTFTNAMSAFGEIYSPELKQLAEWANTLSGGLMDWAKANSHLVRGIVGSIGGLVAFKIGALGIAGAIGLINAAAKMNPFMILVQAAMVAAPLIIENWNWVVENIGGSIDKAVTSVRGAWDGLIRDMKNLWTSLLDFFQPTIDLFVSMFNGIHLPSLPSLPDFGATQQQGMRPPGYQKQNLIAASRVSGAIDVNFNNAPAGMRVAPAAARGPVAVNPNVGYRTIGTGLP